jgi:predicted metal-dependent phosphoesterase TrpH
VTINSPTAPDGTLARMPDPSPSAVERHPHLAAPRRPGWVRVDLHSHTMWSGDSTTTPEELEEAVAECGLDVLCVTDHNAIRGAEALAERLPCRVIVGEHVPFGVSPREAAERIRAQGGLVYVPHPFDPMRRNLAEPALVDLVAAGLVDAIEAFNAKTSLQHLNERAVRFAADHGLPAGAGSDAHVPQALGAAYVEMPDFDGPAEFLANLAEAVVVGHHFDRPRPWSPRIVPSTSA